MNRAKNDHCLVAKTHRCGRNSARSMHSTVRLITGLNEVTADVAALLTTAQEQHKAMISRMAATLDKVMDLSKGVASDEMAELVKRHTDIQDIRNNKTSEEDPEKIMRILNKCKNSIRETDMIVKKSLSVSSDFHLEENVDTSRSSDVESDHEAADCELMNVDLGETLAASISSLENEPQVEPPIVEPHGYKFMGMKKGHVSVDENETNAPYSVEKSKIKRGERHAFASIENGVRIENSEKGDKKRNKESVTRVPLPLTMEEKNTKVGLVVNVPALPQVPSRFLDTRTEPTAKRIPTSQEKTEIAEFIIKNFDRKNTTVAIHDISSVLSAEYGSVAVNTIRSWVTRQRKVNDGLLGVLPTKDNGRPVAVCDKAMADMEDDISDRSSDINTSMLTAYLHKARQKTFQFRKQGGTTAEMCKTTQRKYKLMAMLNMQSTERTQWNTAARALACRSPRNFLGLAAGVVSITTGARPEYGMDAEAAMKNPVSPHFILNHDQTGFQLLGSNAPRDEPWFKMIDDKRAHKEAGATSKRGNVLTQCAKVTWVCCFALVA